MCALAWSADRGRIAVAAGAAGSPDLVCLGQLVFNSATHCVVWPVELDALHGIAATQYQKLICERPGGHGQRDAATDGGRVASLLHATHKKAPA
jgi:hypothetical protein